MTKFVLREWIEAEMADGPADPAVIAARVVDALPSRHLREALRQSLASHVSGIVTRSRGAGMPDARPTAKPSTSNRSKRWKAASVAYKGMLARREHAPNGWKFLGDCTRDDLLWMYEERLRRAAALTTNAGFYKRLAALVDEYGVDTVGELPPDVLRDEAP